LDGNAHVRLPIIRTDVDFDASLRKVTVDHAGDDLLSRLQRDQRLLNANRQRQATERDSRRLFGFQWFEHQLPFALTTTRTIGDKRAQRRYAPTNETCHDLRPYAICEKRQAMW
jgi:hypothetical protein